MSRVETTINLDLGRWKASPRSKSSARIFVLIITTCGVTSAALASWLPLQLSVATVFLFAGPHNWFEFRYFLTRLPIKFGRSRFFFLTAFGGLIGLSLTYVSLPLIYNATSWAQESWLMILAAWNTTFLLWLGILVWQRGTLKHRANWIWAIPICVAVSSLNWLSPELFSLTLVYIHPLIALWFLDRHLGRVRPEWRSYYRRFLFLVATSVALMIWQLSQSPDLRDDNGLFWRITQHSGADLLPNVSSHMLVSIHLYLEMLHYGVWLLALPLITRRIVDRSEPRLPTRAWLLKSIPIAYHSRGFPKIVAASLVVLALAILNYWVGFVVNYSITRDIYFTVPLPSPTCWRKRPFCYVHSDSSSLHVC